jgi:transcriptional regulator with XRE-family HTH domain
MLQPELSPAHRFGAYLRAAREARGLSQAQLGDLVFCSGDLIRRIETATRRPHPDLIARCDDALGTQGALTRLLLDAPPPPDASPPVAMMSLPLLRRSLDGSDCPPDGPTRDPVELAVAVDAIVGLRLQSRYDELAVRLPDLLPELHRAHLRRASATTVRLLVQAYRAADAIADKYGQTDLSARIIDAMRTLAGDSDDALQAATVAYVRAETFMSSRDYDTGRRMLDAAIVACPRSPELRNMAAVGALHMRSAILAARAGDTEDAAYHLGCADRNAASVPDGVYQGTAFGPSSVRIHRISAAIDANDHAAAITAGSGWEPDDRVPAERRSRFHIDLALGAVRGSDLGGAGGGW